MRAAGRVRKNPLDLQRRRLSTEVHEYTSRRNKKGKTREKRKGGVKGGRRIILRSSKRRRKVLPEKTTEVSRKCGP